MATLTLDTPETVRKVADRVVEAGETLLKDAKVLEAKAAELLDEGRLAATKAYRRTRREFEDLRDEAALTVRKAPFATVGIALGAGLLFGVTVGWLATRSRKA